MLEILVPDLLKANGRKAEHGPIAIELCTRRLNVIAVSEA